MPGLVSDDALIGLAGFFITKRAVKSNEEMVSKEMAIEGILEIQAGTNPRILEEKLMTYLSPEEVKILQSERTVTQEALSYE